MFNGRKEVEMKNPILKRLARTMEFVSVGAGLALGAIYLDPMTVHSTKLDIYKTSNPKQVEKFEYRFATYTTFKEVGAVDDNKKRASNT